MVWMWVLRIFVMKCWISSIYLILPASYSAARVPGILLMVKRFRSIRLTTSLAICEPSVDILQPYGPPQPGTGIALFVTVKYNIRFVK
jgi:hypothetical protein